MHVDTRTHTNATNLVEVLADQRQLGGQIVQRFRNADLVVVAKSARRSPTHRPPWKPKQEYEVTFFDAVLRKRQVF